MEAALQNFRVQKWVAALSAVLLIIKFVAYLITNSVAILTDALESIVNVAAGLMGLYSLYLSAKPRDADHPYGHGKVEFISAALEGSMIFIAGVLIVYEAIKALIAPHTLQQLDTGMVLVLLAAVVNFVLGYWCIKTGKRNNSLALEASGKHLQSDTYTTLGIVVGVGLIYLTNLNWIDSVVAMLFAGLLLYTGFKIIRASVSGIMDEQDASLMGRVVEVLNRHRRENWVDLHNARIIKFGSVLHLDCHLTVPWYFTVQEAHHEVVELTRLVREEFGPSVELFVHSDYCEEFSCPVCIKKECNVRKAPFRKQLPWSVANISSHRKHDAGTEENPAK